MRSSDRLYSKNEYNPLYCILKAVKLYSYNLNITQRRDSQDPHELNSHLEYNSETLTRLGDILRIADTCRVAFYALDAGAVTERTLVGVLGLNQTSATRAIAMLRDYEVLLPALPIRRPRGARGGRRVTVYETPEATPDQVAAAIELQRRLESPKYCEAARFAQLLLEEYLSRGRGEITYRDLLDRVRVANLPYSAPDMAELAAQVLAERGLRVWR